MSFIGRAALVGLVALLLATGGARSARASVHRGPRMAWDAFDRLVSQWAAIWSVPRVILWVVATLESGRRPGLVNLDTPEARARGGAWGLFGVTFRTAQDLMLEPPLGQYAAAARWDGTPESLLDPGLNAMIGSYYLAQQWRTFGAFLPTVAAYQQGPAPVKRIVDAGGNLATDLPPKGREYVRRALLVRRELEGEGIA